LILHVGRCPHIVRRNLGDILKVPCGMTYEELSSSSETATDEPEDYHAELHKNFQEQFKIPIIGGPKNAQVFFTFMCSSKNFPIPEFQEIQRT
jgi:hypothetical protein